MRLYNAIKSITASFNLIEGAVQCSSIGCASAWYAGGRGFDCYVRQKIISWRFGNEKMSTAILSLPLRGARWLSGRVSDSGARGPGFETYRRRVVSLSKTLYFPKVLVNYPGSDGSVPT